MSEFISPKHYSVSSLLLHRKNPRRWCLRYLCGLKDAQTNSLDFGNKIHLSLESMIKTGTFSEVYNPKTKKVLHEWHTEFKRKYGDENDSLHRWKTETEFTLLDKDMVKPLVGRIDLALSDFVPVVFDHKTSKPGYVLQENDLKKDWQLALYAYVSRKDVSSDYMIGQNQFIKTSSGVGSYKIVSIMLTEKELNATIKGIKDESVRAYETEQSFTKHGLISIRATPEYNVWYGKLDPMWDVICGKESIEEFKKTWNMEGV